MGAANVSMADIVCQDGLFKIRWVDEENDVFDFSSQTLFHSAFCFTFYHGCCFQIRLPKRCLNGCIGGHEYDQDKMPLLTVWWAQVAQLAEVRREDAPEESAQTIPFRRGDAWCNFIMMRWEQCCTRRVIFVKHQMIDVVTAISAILSKRPWSFKSIFKVSETSPGLRRSHASGWCLTSRSCWSWSRSSPQSWCTLWGPKPNTRNYSSWNGSLRLKQYSYLYRFPKMSRLFIQK